MITVSDMRRLEDESEKNGVSKLQLMENAGRRCYDVLNEKFDLKNKKILILASHGNNSGDGFVVARYAEESDATILCIGDEGKFSPETKINFDRLANLPVQFTEDVDFNDFDVIVDAFLGTGVQGTLRTPMAEYIKEFNQATGIKVSVDVPTGVNPDTGEHDDVYAQPDVIVTFHDIKKGLEKYKEKTVVVDIGIKS